MQAPASVERPGRPGCPWPAIGVADRAGEVARTQRRRLARLACGPCSSRSRRLAARSRRREVYEGLDHDQYCAGDVKLRVESRTFAWACRTLPGAVPPGAHARPSPQAAVAASRQSYAVPAPNSTAERAATGSTPLPLRTGSVYHCGMAERATPSHSPSRYAAVAALFTALEQLMHEYRSLPDSEHLTRWSEDAERITGEVARHLAVARARISTGPHHDAR